MYSSYKAYKTDLGETVDLGKSVCYVSDTYLPDDIFLAGLRSDIQKLEMDISRLMGRRKTGKYTKEIGELHSTRYNLAYVMDTAIKSLLIAKKFNSEKSEAAERLSTILKSTPIKSRAPYAERSFHINTRLQALNNDECRKDIITTGIESYVDGFRETQKQFELVTSSIYTQRSKKIRGTLIDEQRKMIKVIKFALSYLEAQNIAQPKIYGKSAKQILVVITRIMSTANARQTRKQNP